MQGSRRFCASIDRFGPRGQALLVAAAVLVVLKLALVALSGPFMDETYYWMWGQHPALSYFDHPPLTGWLQGLAADLFGWNRFALRIVPVVTTAIDGVLLYLFSRRLAPEAWRRHFLVTLVLFLSTPIFVVLTAAAFPDHMMIVTGLAALYCFYVYLDDFAAERRPGPWRLYLGALFLGLAVLSKYNGAFLGLGLAAFIIAAPRLRPLLRNPHLYLAAGLSLLVQTPVLVWNYGRHFASYDHVLVTRPNGVADAALGIGLYLAGVLVSLLPFLIWPTARYVLGRGNRRSHPALGLGAGTFWVSSLFFAGLATQVVVLFHWNVAAYVAILPFVALYIERMWLVWAQALTGALILAGVVFNYSVVPILAISGPGDQASAWVYGWDATARQVHEEAAKYRTGFVAGTDYAVTSLIGFAMRDPAVTSLWPETDAYDFWFDAAAHAGEDAIIVADRWKPLRPDIEDRFGSVELLDTIPVIRFGRQLDVHRIYLGRDFRPPD